MKFAQVLKQNAMKGRCKKPPMQEPEMMDLAKALLYRKGSFRIEKRLKLELVVSRCRWFCDFCRY